ncbi:Na+ transporting oxaloacetate decarboxylase subunit beta [Streptococcus sanguinis SK160]|uniref:Na+ transporting oxaloacetate decarboxylase subunit beta n=1 Tax=Streptococcus sanguinis SK160 TaxID=888812 RepID=F0IS41_STRSA|nr:Na+ transporting oxaloacetate decarboxylase subunit beta [Streptococcus sanguinis SK160]
MPEVGKFCSKYTESLRRKSQTFLHVLLLIVLRDFLVIFDFIGGWIFALFLRM